ncbi:MAG: septation protein IspZ [Bdellovibrionota bacterium]
MKDKLKGLINFAFVNFGPLIVFYGTNRIYGLKIAIIASTLFSFAEIAWRLYRRLPITNLFKFSATVTILFGLVDLYAQQSFLFKYEASATNVLTGVFFGASLFSSKCLLQEFYEQRKDAKAVTPDLAGYFRLLTLIWVLYFWLKAAVYFWIAGRFSLEQGLLVRTVLGSGSFYLMLGISIFGSRKIFPLLKKWGFFRYELVAVEINSSKQL